MSKLEFFVKSINFMDVTPKSQWIRLKSEGLELTFLSLWGFCVHPARPIEECRVRMFC